MIKLITFIICLFVIHYNYKNDRFLSSASIWVFCYILIFLITPTFTNEIYTNEDIIDIYALGGIVSFFLGLLLSRNSKGSNITLKNTVLPDYRVLCIGFIICFVISIITLEGQIGTINSIINTNTTSKVLFSERGNEMDAHDISVQIMLCLAFSIFISAKDKKQRLISILFVCIYIVESLMLAFTRVFLISLIGMILLYIVRNKSQAKQALYSAMGALGLLSLLIIMNFIRCFGFGSKITFGSVFNLSYMFESSDFSASYYWFDKLLSIDSPYINPLTYLKPFLIFIPRSVWSDKPEQVSMQILKILDPALASSGYSTAGYSVLGEGYGILGYLGIFFSPFIWGIICDRLDFKYTQRLKKGVDNSLQNVSYYIFAVFVVICGQRGDWNQYMINVIWLYLFPLYVMRKLRKVKNKP